MKFFERVHDRGGVVHQGVPLNQSREHHNHGDVEQRANNERCNNTDRQVALRILTFLGSRGDRIKSDVGEENDRSAGQNAGPTVRCEGVVVCRMDEFGRKSHEHQNGDNLQQHHNVVGSRGLFDAPHQNHRQQHHDDESGPVKTKMPACAVQHVSLQVGESAGKVGWRNPAGIRIHAEPVQ